MLLEAAEGQAKLTLKQEIPKYIISKLGLNRDPLAGMYIACSCMALSSLLHSLDFVVPVSFLPLHTTMLGISVHTHTPCTDLRRLPAQQCTLTGSV